MKGTGISIVLASLVSLASVAAAQDFPKAEKLRKKAAKKLSAEQIAEVDAVIASRAQTP